MGIDAVTVYAFSIENFNRPEEEVNDLMALLRDKLDYLRLGWWVLHGGDLSGEGEKDQIERSPTHLNCLLSDMVRRHEVSVRVLGRLDMLPDSFRTAAEQVVAATAHNKRKIFNICVAYTARDDILTAACRTMRGVKSGQLLHSDIDKALLERCLLTADSPPVDLLLRTSGEVRLSDFLLWQCAEHCRIYFVDAMWPELSRWQLAWILLDYQWRHTQQLGARPAGPAISQLDGTPTLDAATGLTASTLDRLLEKDHLATRQTRISTFLGSFTAHHPLPHHP